MVLEDDWKLSRFDILRITRKPLGEGAGGACFKSVIEGVHVVVKISERFHHSMGVKMMESEVKAYKALKSLQGEIIPEFYHYQQYGAMKILIISFIDGRICNPELDSNTWVQKKVEECLGAFHAKGITHGDIRPSNIIVQDSPPKIWLIDLGLARESTDERQHRWEIEELPGALS